MDRRTRTTMVAGSRRSQGEYPTDSYGTCRCPLQSVEEISRMPKGAGAWSLIAPLLPITMQRMRSIRLLVVLVTLLTLPIYGLAGMTQRSCQDQMSASGHAASQIGDCCPGKSDRGTSCKGFGDGSSGKGSCTACKAGYNCKVPHSYEPAFAGVLYFLPLRSFTSTDVSPLLIATSPDGLWRPPTLS
jgi:hypothetical protein